MIIEEKNLIQSIKKYKTDVDFIKKSINEIVKGKIKFPEVVESEDNFRLARVVVESIKGEFKNIDKSACKKFDLNDDDVIDNFIGMLKLLFNFKDEDLINFNLKDSLVIVRDLFEEIRKKKAEEEKELLKKKQEEIKKNNNKEELKEEVNNNEEFKKDNEVKDEIEDNNKNVLL
ncbi:hypothetical protein A0H76_2359 [Hepatospora eriocheir]|uniref:Uncharacterized protein n=1 Tax=Hepatospora eriocheir TaxID=1081669 RepID=A0A1X0QJV8_9MICR|nr:hypothetical protein A0H76_2359 [Hepatospora eriocheir]